MSTESLKKEVTLKVLKSINDGLTELVSELQSVDESPDTETNETTISDNNGGRIELGHESPNTKIIKKI